MTSALKDDSSFLGVHLLGNYNAAQLEERLGENGNDDVTRAVHFLSLQSWPHQTEDAGIIVFYYQKVCFVKQIIY